MDIPLTLEINDSEILSWWVDETIAIHPDMKSHTGATVSLGGGCPFSLSLTQQINTQSSREAKLVGVNDAMYLILWTLLFLEGQILQGHRQHGSPGQPECNVACMKW